jgi:pyruvate/2-oxoglutarate dehydrogenase complex dihydrolipoamide dehydrogenase (E3) component
MERYDLVIVGLGSGGIVAAELASAIGLSVAAVETARVGGDCLWTGCVPSKALLASAKAAHQMRTATRVGLAAHDPGIDTRRVWDRIRTVREEIAATDDSPDRLAALGVHLVWGRARLSNPHTVEVLDGGGTVTARLATRFVLLCTGSRPAVPDIEGLHTVEYLTNESVFDVDEVPRSVAVLGGGPVGVELAQALQRLGIQTTVLQRGPRVLPRDEPALVELLTATLRAEGVDVQCDVDVTRVEPAGRGVVVHGRNRDDARRFHSDGLLVAVGRVANVAGLGLEALGIPADPRGIAVDDRLRTSIESVYAAGDVTTRPRFTHAAAYEAATAVRNMFFPGRSRARALVPWCTFTDPELAHAGMTYAEAHAAHGDRAKLWRHDLVHNDRARADAQIDGSVLLVTARRRLVGAHVLAPAAGELIHELTHAIERGTRLDELAGVVHVYPTIGTSVAKLAADAAFEKARRYRWLVRRRASTATAR